MKNEDSKNTDKITEIIRKLLLSGHVSTQEDIKQQLKQHGLIVNQSKISRVLRKLGAIKTSSEQQIIYTLPHEPAPPAARNVLLQLITDITHNETLIVIRTNPGSASMIARLIDHHGQELKILGTVAGDDTVFIAPASIKHIKKCVNAIKSFLALRNNS